MKILVTGAAGFIGSHLVDRLLCNGHDVIGVDCFSTGHREFLFWALNQPRFQLYERDLLHPTALQEILDSSFQHVVHFSAHADVRFGLETPRRDLEQNTIVTSNILEAMRFAGVKSISFASTGSIYGEALIIPTPENCPFPVQTSLYGASKLAAEGMMSAYAEGYGFQVSIFRFVSVLGERYTHGHVFDFVKQLKKDPFRLTILGNGKQKKSYLYVEDCVEAVVMCLESTPNKRVEIYNLGTDEYVQVDESLEVICEEMKVQPEKTYTGGDRGWVGDNPFIFLDCRKIQERGWKPKKNIREGIRITVRYILTHPELMEKIG